MMICQLLCENEIHSDFSHLEMDFETFPAINKDSLNLVLRHLGICSISMLSSVVHDLEVIFDVKYLSLSPLHV